MTEDAKVIKVQLDEEYRPLCPDCGEPLAVEVSMTFWDNSVHRDVDDEYWHYSYFNSKDAESDIKEFYCDSCPFTAPDVEPVPRTRKEAA